MLSQHTGRCIWVLYDTSRMSTPLVHCPVTRPCPSHKASSFPRPERRCLSFCTAAPVPSARLPTPWTPFCRGPMTGASLGSNLHQYGVRLVVRGLLHTSPFVVHSDPQCAGQRGQVAGCPDGGQAIQSVVSGSAAFKGSPKLCVVVKLLLLAPAIVHKHCCPSHEKQD